MKRTLPQIGCPLYSPMGAECDCSALVETMTTPWRRRYEGSVSFANCRCTIQCSGSAMRRKTASASRADMSHQKQLSHLFLATGAEREAHQLSEIARAELFHDARLVHLDRARTDAERGADLLGVQALRGELEHLALARGERGELGGVAGAREARVLAREGGLDRGPELRVVEGLLEEVDRIGLECGARRGHVAVRGDDDEGQHRAARAQLGLQLEAALSRQAQVGRHAAGPLGAPGGEEGLGVREQRGAVSGESEHERERVAHAGVVVDHVDRQLVTHGKTRWKAPPSPASSEPPCASAIARLTARPRPMPLALPETSGSNTASRLAGGTPGPLSATTMRAWRPSGPTVTAMRPPGAPSSASTELAIRLRSTSSSC